MSTSFCTHGEIQQRNNIILISKDGCIFVLKNRLIPSIDLILDFWQLFNTGIEYSGLNTARSALSSFLMLNVQESVSNNTLVKRFMRGIFLLKPSLPRYNFTWDVSIFLNYSQQRQLNVQTNDINTLYITLLLTAQRLQSIHLIDKRNILFNVSVVKIQIWGSC